LSSWCGFKAGGGARREHEAAPRPSLATAGATFATPFPDFMRDQIGCYAPILQIAVRHLRQFLAAMMTSRPQLHGQCDAKPEISQSLAPVANPAG